MNAIALQGSHGTLLHSLMALYHNKEVSLEITSFGLEGEMF